MVVLAGLHGMVFLAFPCLPVVAIGLWWNSNTVAHYFIHRPFFRSRAVNAFFALYQSVLLGIPQALWRDRHLAHHANASHRLRWRPEFLVQTTCILLSWICLALVAPRFFATVYLPGYLVGLSLCYLHGYFEHVRGTTSHYGRLYNLLFFNDGYHVEHHAQPGRHWTELPQCLKRNSVSSRYPAVLRWLECLGLNTLEQTAIHFGIVRRFLLWSHGRALERLLPQLRAIERIGIVGGGLFPRTALLCQRFFPNAELVIIDGSADSIAVAKRFLQGPVHFVHEWFDPARHDQFDLLIVPLALVGRRAEFYDRPRVKAVLVHDWIWRRRGTGTIVSWLLLKRINLVRS